MSGLKIKHYHASGVIRSVGEEPNGVLGISNHPDTGCVIVIDPKVQPMTASGSGPSFQHVGKHPDENGAVIVTAEQVVEAAIHCSRTAAVIWQSAVANLQLYASLVGDSFDVETVAEAARLVQEVRDQLAVNGLISKQGG